MTVMITGGAGYVGSQLVPALVKEGYRVKVVDNLTFGSRGLRHCMDQIELIPLDIRDLEKAHFSGVDTIIHLAGISNDPTAEYDPVATKAINLDATIKLAKQAKKYQVRKFIFASSCSVYYTEQPDNTMRDERDPVHPTSPYSWSKREAEIQLLHLASQDFCPVILRKGTIFGHSGRMRFDLVVNTFTLHAFTKGTLTVLNEGRMWRPLLYIEDAVEIYKALILKNEQEVRGQIYNALNDNYQVFEIAEEIRKVVESKSRIHIDIRREGDARSYRIDGSKLKQLMGLTTGNSINSAVVKMWDELSKGIDHHNDIYYNIRWLESLQEKKFTALEFQP